MRRIYTPPGIGLIFPLSLRERVGVRERLPLRSLLCCPIPNLQSPIRNPQSAIPNPQSAIRNPQSPIRNPQSAIRNPQSPIPNPQSPIRNPQSPIRNPQSAIRNPQSAIPNPQSGEGWGEGINVDMAPQCPSLLRLWIRFRHLGVHIFTPFDECLMQRSGF